MCPFHRAARGAMCPFSRCAFFLCPFLVPDPCRITGPSGVVPERNKMSRVASWLSCVALVT